jgi:hypothetical protein
VEHSSGKFRDQAYKKHFGVLFELGKLHDFGTAALPSITKETSQDDFRQDGMFDPWLEPRGLMFTSP